MLRLAGCYMSGNGVTQNVKKGYEWNRRAAQAGEVAAMYNLGLCYEQGSGVGQNHTTAMTWFRKAAKGGHPDATTIVRAEDDPAFRQELAFKRLEQVMGGILGAMGNIDSSGADVEPFHIDQNKIEWMRHNATGIGLRY
jgi:TPR repeat protein